MSQQLKCCMVWSMFDTYWPAGEWLQWWDYKLDYHFSHCSMVCKYYHDVILLMFKIFTLSIMQLEKYKTYDFGRCPRVYCCGQPCLPVGQSDIPRSSTVKIYCPKCEDIYYPRSKYQGSILMSAERLFNVVYLNFYYLWFVLLIIILFADAHTYTWFILQHSLFVTYAAMMAHKRTYHIRK